jgi:SAM-dependent methyltransferase
MKSQTDLHWGRRAASVANDVEVNIVDVFQRELEYAEIQRYLAPGMRVLETGCGNGFSTARFRTLVRHVDAFDYSQEMVERARTTLGERNNRFLHDNVLSPRHLEGPYDCVLCIRVLINLRDLAEQRTALANLRGLVAPGGLLILVEGFADGFMELTRLRGQLGLPPVQPAPINFYSKVEELRPEMERGFAVEHEFHLGAYDYLTRVAYPLLVGPDNVVPNSEFSEKCRQLAAAFNPEQFRGMSRVRGFVLRRNS